MKLSDAFPQKTLTSKKMCQAFKQFYQKSVPFIKLLSTSGPSQPIKDDCLDEQEL